MMIFIMYTHKIYFIIRAIKPWKERWVVHVVCIEEMRNIFIYLVRNLERKIQFAGLVT